MKMWLDKKIIFLQIICCFSLIDISYQRQNEYNFVVKEANYTRLCSTKPILTVNGKFPGPIIRAYYGETVYVNVHNKGKYNITLHWHGVAQPRNPWSDGPEYITQCPIKPGGKFRQKLKFSIEEGTLWWHAHSDWLRATVHGPIFIYPRKNTSYPFQKPDAEVTVILGEWWKSEIMDIQEEFLRTGGGPNISDALTINGQPGDLYPCSKSETFKLNVDPGKTYLLRIINAAMNVVLFFSVSKHNLTVVAADASYTKPLTRDYICIAPGQTVDALLHANQEPNNYYMAARVYSSSPVLTFVNSTTTARLHYSGNYTPTSSPSLPKLPYYNDTRAAYNYFGSIKGLPKRYPYKVPTNITTHIVTTISLNTFPCSEGQICEGPNRTRSAASMNNVSFQTPSSSILQAYYNHVNGVYDRGFPSLPPFIFNFTAEYLPLDLEIPKRGTDVKVIKYGSTVEVVFQGTRLLQGIDHPMHLHGTSFYFVGQGLGNFDKHKDRKTYNLVDPPFINTVLVPINGWAAIRYRASNPGVWFLHCHLERHLSWGMETVFIVKNGKGHHEKVLPPPPDMPPC
ncbi:PREDICTED: laccase-15-like [Lupinus angustifolius]|uniref:laccase-15-like n=1 Tax=Lupinus angustifolius TaxID=3871 RepID=UPI00092EEAC3|nr:PREDICTED: laccase-15-like [Lupinus angustifolius]